MTKHVPPEITGTELSTDYDRYADYRRFGDDAIMRWDGKLEGGIGSFNAVPGSFEVKRDTKRDNSAAPSEDGSVIGDTESFHDTKESPKRIGLKFMQSRLEKLFDTEPSEEEAEADSEKDSLEETGKRRVRAKPRCNTDPSRRIRAKPRKIKGPDFGFDLCNHFHFRHGLVAPLAALKIRCMIAWSPTARFRERTAGELRLSPFFVLSGTCDETSKSRARQERYNVEAPKNDSEIIPRKPRNSGSAKASAWLWAEYRRLNGSLEPLQTGFGKSDGEFVDFPNEEDGEAGGKPEVKYPLDSTMETRPNEKELERGWTGAKYETRMVHTSDYPRLIEPGYCLTCGKTEMKIPVSGSVECVGFSKVVMCDLGIAARETMTEYWKRQATEPNPNWPKPKRKNEKQIGIVVGRTATKERFNISEVDMSKSWQVRRVGGLRFAPYETKYYRLGQLTHYQDKNGIEHRAKVDVPKKARGPAFFGSADKNNEDEMKRKGWAPLHPVMRKTRQWKLSGAEKAEQWANDVPKFDEYRKLYHGSVAPVPCHELYHERVGDPNRPYHKRMVGRRHPFDNKPVPTERPGSDHAFGKTYTKPEEPADDVVERKSTLAAVNAMLTPQGLIVANAVVRTELTKDLPSSPEAMGVLLWPGVENPSKSTLRRLGEQAIQDTEEELRVIFQALSA
jgi:hypothetical protein